MTNEGAETLYAMGFIDGQNLYQHAKDAFGHHHPNYDPLKLHQAVCQKHGWTPTLVHFYTGVPDCKHERMWAGYWSNRVLALKRANVQVTTRPLRYREESVFVADGSEQTVVTPQEKGIDIRLALDIVRLARTRSYDVCVIYSQDQDLQEATEEVKTIGREQGRQIIVACAFPSGQNATSKRGIDKTQWIRMDETFYNACLDDRDYRPRR